MFSQKCIGCRVEGRGRIGGKFSHRLEVGKFLTHMYTNEDAQYHNKKTACTAANGRKSGTGATVLKITKAELACCKARKIVK